MKLVNQNLKIIRRSVHMQKLAGKIYVMMFLRFEPKVLIYYHIGSE